jgi:ribosome-binding protein aMBF1 (putative translation factor)
LRTSKDIDDPPVSISYGPNAAQEVSGPLMVHSIGELLRTRREELGLSRRELAERAGTSHSAIARVETGHRRITVDTLQRIANALNVQLIIRLRDGGEGSPS